MWTIENRGRYDRSQLRDPSDLTEDEWGVIARLIPRAKRGGTKRKVDVREVVNGLMYILSAGCQRRALPKDLPPRSTVSTVHGYPARWQDDGTLDRLHHALYVVCRDRAGRDATPTATIIDSQNVKSAEKDAMGRAARVRHHRRCQAKAVEAARLERLQQPTSPDGPHAKVRLIAQVIGVGIETADMLVHEILLRNLRDHRALARDASLTGSPDESATRRREKSPTRGAQIDPHGFDAGKKIKGKKRHVLVDTQGLLLQALVHSADIQDRDGGVLLMAALFGLYPFLEKFYADSGDQEPKFKAGLRQGRRSLWNPCVGGGVVFKPLKRPRAGPWRRAGFRRASPKNPEW